ncbi:MAG: tyrosine-type recombinase/integrase [Proteobacteria bacterium]|nr:tyrosine-type recombinase/integrase [Pseudomonadota bacterium]
MPRKYPRHFVTRPSGHYFQATPAMQRAGICSEPLGTEMVAAIARADALNASWDEIRRGLEPVAKRPALPGSLSHLIEELRRSREWSDKAPRTREEWEYALAIIVPIFGTYALKQITPDACRDFYDALRETGSIHRAARVMKWLRYLFNFAIRFDKTDINPTLAVRIKHPKPRQQIWREDQVLAAIAKAIEVGRPCMATAVAIAYDTSLRESDILSVPWTGFQTSTDGNGMSLFLDQGKTGVPISCPLAPETVAMIEPLRTSGGVIPLASAPIIRGPHGRPYKKDNFTHRFRDICQAAGIPDDLQFRDIRRTVVTEVAAGEGTSAEIASTTGHSIAHSQRILDTYTVTSEAMARNAKAKRNKRRPKV